MNDSLGDVSKELPSNEALAFSPLHKLHFGTAVGLTSALVVVGATMIDLLTGRDGSSPLTLLNQFFYGYSVSPVGLAVGGLWAFFVGWVGGWFVAFSRNFVMALMVFWIRARANLEASREFLDHI